VNDDLGDILHCPCDNRVVVIDRVHGISKLRHKIFTFLDYDEVVVPWGKIWMVRHKVDSGEVVWFNWVYVVAKDPNETKSPWVAYLPEELSPSEFMLRRLRDCKNWEKV